MSTDHSYATRTRVGWLWWSFWL